MRLECVKFIMPEPVVNSCYYGIGDVIIISVQVIIRLGGVHINLKRVVV